MKGKILKILKAQKAVVSGEDLSGKLGITRVSVWKHIKKLKELGYDIQAGTGGYQFISSPDALFPWEFSGREDRIHFFQETGSTMDAARKLAREGCPDFSVVIAERQNKGRGRLKRSWLSEKGGLYFTIVLRPQMPSFLSFRLNFAASLALVKILNKKFSINAGVKWPNDIMAEGAKISGMLSEMEAEGEMVSFINIGIGINVNNTPAIEDQKAVSIKTILGRKVNRRDILTEFLCDFENMLKEKGSLDHVIQEWKEHTITIGRHVKVATTGKTYTGKAVDVDENGGLVLELDDGTLKKVIYGDCFMT